MWRQWCGIFFIILCVISSNSNAEQALYEEKNGRIMTLGEKNDLGHSTYCFHLAARVMEPLRLKVEEYKLLAENEPHLRPYYEGIQISIKGLIQRLMIQLAITGCLDGIYE